MAIELILPANCKPAVLRTKVVFYRWPKNGNRLTIGFPDQFPAPPGVEKIICTTAREVERYSALLRQQEKDDRERNFEWRESIEGPMRNYVRGLLRQGKANARNQLNRDFCDGSLARLDAKEEQRKKETVESYMHVEGFEAGK